MEFECGSRKVMENHWSMIFAEQKSKKEVNKDKQMIIFSLF